MKLHLRIFSIIILILSAQFLLAKEYYWSEPENLSSINSNSDDFAPVFSIFDSTLYFNSQRDGYSYFYKCKLIDGNAIDIKKLNSPINKNKSNQSYFSFITDKKAIFNTFSNRDGNISQDLYYAYYNKKAWSEGELIKELSDNSFNMQATISPDGQSIIFISNNGNKIGDTDLWAAEKKLDGLWDTPYKLDDINSLEKEMTPFLASNDTLFFASNGFGGNRGFDIFMSIKKLDEWQRPRPLNDLNSDFDDSDFILLPNGDAIFASNRLNGVGNLDLYYAKKTLKKDLKEKQSQLEISLNTNLESITIKKSYKFNYKNINPYFYFDNSFNLDNERSKINNSNLLFLKTELKNNKTISLYAFTPNISELNTNSDNSKFIADKRLKTIIEKLKAKFGKNKFNYENIKTEYKYYDPKKTKLKNLLFISSSNLDYTNNKNINNSNYTLNPKAINFVARARPDYMFKKFNFQFKNENLKSLFDTSSVELPFELTLNLSNFKDTIIKQNSDKLNFYLEAKDNHNNTSYNELSININKLEFYELDFNNNNQKYFQVGITIYDLEHLKLSNSIEKFIRDITKNTILIQKIRILSNPSEINVAKYIKEIIEKSNMNQNIEIEKVDDLKPFKILIKVIII